MAAALLGRALKARGVTDIEIFSAGVLEAGAPAASRAREVLPDLAEHTSRELSSDAVRDADLIVGMERSHVREVIVRSSEAFERTFTLKQLARVGYPRASDETLREWARRIGAARSPFQYLGDSTDDDLADPIGQPRRAFEKTAMELSSLVERLLDVAWPGPAAVAS